MSSTFRVSQKLKKFHNLHSREVAHSWIDPLPEKLVPDIAQWNEFIEPIKRRIKSILYLLVKMEPEIIDNVEDIIILMKRVLGTERSKEFAMLFILLDFQKAMEGIHTLSYMTVNDSLQYNGPIDDMEDFVKLKTDIISKWRKVDSITMNDKKLLARAIVANVLSEGLVFNESFNIFFFLRKKGLLEATGIVNFDVLFDENMHCECWIDVYHLFVEEGIIDRLSNEEMFEMVNDFVSVNDKASEYLLGNQTPEEKSFLLTMSKVNSDEYCRILANTILKSLKYPKLYNTGPNPYPFVEVSLLNTLVSFFDSDPEYSIDVDNPQENESDPEDDE